MFKRVLAWIMLAGFVFLIVNMVFGIINRGLTLTIYTIVVLAFIFTNRGLNPKKPQD